MNKKTLSLAVAAAAAGAAPAVFAAQDLTATTNANLLYFATENTVLPTGSTVENAGNVLDVVTKVGFSITDAAERYIRYDITGATFAANMADGDLVVESAANNATASISAGGAAKDSYVIYEVSTASDAANNAVSPTNNATIALPNLTITGESGVSISYALYSTPEAAVANSGTALGSDSGAIVAFTAAGTHGAVTSTAANIDVGQGNTYFASGTKAATTVIGAFKNTVTPTITVYALPDASTQVNTTAGLATIAGNTTLEVMGDFSFVQDLDTDGAPDGTFTTVAAPVFIANGTDCNASVTVVPNATSLTATKATFNLTGTADVGDDTYYVCATANGASTIPEQTFTGTISTSGSTGVYDAESASVTLGTLSKNGTNVTLNLALTPGGAFSNFVRIVNTSGISGDVSMTVFNDSGDSVNIDMGDIDGVDSSSLGAQSSTDLITVSAIYDAAVAGDATFDVGSGKLRISIDGEFTSIDAQSITLSTDNTTFTTF